MTLSRRQYVGVVCLAVLSWAGTSPAAGPVVLISVDGLRPDAIEAAHTPQIDALISGGSYTDRALCEIPASTLPNHTTMLTGLSVARHGVRFNTEVEGTVGFPTIHDHCAAAGLRGGFYASKAKLAYLVHLESVDEVVIRSDSQELVDLVIEQILTDTLDFIFLHIRDPDSTGHEFGWMSPEYLAAVEVADGQIAQIVDALAEAELYTAHLLVTADHGGQGAAHFLNVPQVRHVPWIAWGPAVAAGRILCAEVRQADTPATVLALLGLPVPPSYSGEAVTEALTFTVQPICEPQEPELGSPCAILWAPFIMLLAAQLMYYWRWRHKRVEEFRS